MFSIVAVTNLHSQKQSRRVPFFPHPLPLLLSVVFLRMAILTSVCWYVFVVWICSSLIFSYVKHLFMCLQEQQQQQQKTQQCELNWPLEIGLLKDSPLLNCFLITGGLLRGSSVKNQPTMQEIGVQSLGREDPLEKGMATHSSIPAWRIAMDRRAWRATVHGITKSGTWLSN